MQLDPFPGFNGISPGFIAGTFFAKPALLTIPPVINTEEEFFIASTASGTPYVEPGQTGVLMVVTLKSGGSATLNILEAANPLGEGFGGFPGPGLVSDFRFGIPEPGTALVAFGILGAIVRRTRRCG
ncbi:MAG: hypothetical protein AAF823_10340 [Planctomycetota bacterium]